MNIKGATDQHNSELPVSMKNTWIWRIFPQIPAVAAAHTARRC